MIAGYQQYRGAQGRESQLEEPVAPGLVLDQVAGDEDGVRGQKTPARVGDAGLECRQRAHAAHHPLRILEQVRIRELHEP